MHTGTDHRIQIASHQARLAELAPPRPRRRLPGTRLIDLLARATASLRRWRRERADRRAPVGATPCLTVSSHSRGSR